MLIRRPPDIRPSEITDESIYLNRRQFLKLAGLTIGGITLGTAGPSAAAERAAQERALEGVVASPYSTDEPPNSWEDVTTYNNFYEFGTGKEDPARNARDFRPRPWEVAVGGECERPGTVAYEDLVRPHALEERIYRLR
jgi:sulfoxide reductase catalytic subunit YedY